ncbi:MAG: sulfotransferase domain-containing protein [Cyanobacteria bacterium P01_D01_bin.44]
MIIQWKKRKRSKNNPYACQNVNVFEGDTYLVSYPKSGNTWLRFLIANLLARNPKEVSLSGLEKVVPDVYRNTNEELALLPRPRVLKSHESFAPKYKKVIYVVRDPRDVAVSYYHHLIKSRKIEEGYPLQDWIEEFVQGRYVPQFGTWKQNVGSWVGARQGDEDFLLISYEQLLDNGLEVLKRISAFLELKVSIEKIKEAILLSSADRMRKIEAQENWQPSLGDMRSDKRFVRSAKSGGWKEELSPKSADLIFQNWGDLMQSLGYLE